MGGGNKSTATHDSSFMTLSNGIVNQPSEIAGKVNYQGGKPVFVVDWDSCSLESCESIDGDKHAEKEAVLDMGKTPSTFDDVQSQQAQMMHRGFSNISDISNA